MNYDDEIIRILLEAGVEGISIRKIARHVYNACNSLFEPEDYESVHGYVAKFLTKKSRDSKSAVIRAKIRGRYCLDMKRWKAQQAELALMFDGDSKW